MPTHSDFVATLTRQDASIRCACRGTLTAASYASFRPLFAALDEAGVAEVALDFAQVRFLDTHGLMMLETLRRHLAERGARMSLVNAQGSVARLLAVCHAPACRQTSPAGGAAQRAGALVTSALTADRTATRCP